MTLNPCAQRPKEVAHLWDVGDVASWDPFVAPGGGRQLGTVDMKSDELNKGDFGRGDVSEAALIVVSDCEGIESLLLKEGLPILGNRRVLTKTLLTSRLSCNVLPDESPDVKWEGRHVLSAQFLFLLSTQLSFMSSALFGLPSFGSPGLGLPDLRPAGFAPPSFGPHCAAEGCGWV